MGEKSPLGAGGDGAGLLYGVRNNYPTSEVEDPQLLNAIKIFDILLRQ